VSSSADNSSKVTAIRARLEKFSTVDAFVEGYNQYFFRGGMLLPTRQSREVGTPVSLQLEIGDGTTVVRADGEVQQVRTNESGRAVGMVIRFKRVDAATRDLMARILRERHERRTGSHSVVTETPQAPAAGAQSRPAPFAPPKPASSRLADEDINAIENALDSTFDSIFGSTGSFGAVGADDDDASDSPFGAPAASDDDALPFPSRAEATDDGPSTLTGVEGDEETLHGVRNVLGGENAMDLRRELAASVAAPTAASDSYPATDDGPAPTDEAPADDVVAPAVPDAPAEPSPPAAAAPDEGDEDDGMGLDIDIDIESDDEDEADAPAAAAPAAPATPAAGPVPRSTVFGMRAFASIEGKGAPAAAKADDASDDSDDGEPASARDVLSSLLDDAEEAAPDRDLAPASASQPLTRLALQRKSKAELDAERRAALRALNPANDTTTDETDGDDDDDEVIEAGEVLDDDASPAVPTDSPFAGLEADDDDDLVEDALTLSEDDDFGAADAPTGPPALPGSTATDDEDDAATSLDFDFDGPDADDEDEGEKPADEGGLKDLLHGIAAADDDGPPVMDPADALRRLESQTGDSATDGSSDGDDALDALLAQPGEARPVVPPSVQLTKAPEKKGIFQRFFAWLARLFGGK